MFFYYDKLKILYTFSAYLIFCYKLRKEELEGIQIKSKTSMAKEKKRPKQSLPLFLSPLSIVGFWRVLKSSFITFKIKT